MTTASAFHFESLVWDWPIAVYLFLIGISAGLVVLAVLLRQYYPNAAGSDSTLMRTRQMKPTSGSISSNYHLYS